MEIQVEEDAKRRDVPLIGQELDHHHQLQQLLQVGHFCLVMQNLQHLEQNPHLSGVVAAAAVFCPLSPGIWMNLAFVDRHFVAVFVVAVDRAVGVTLRPAFCLPVFGPLSCHGVIASVVVVEKKWRKPKRPKMEKRR